MPAIKVIWPNLTADGKVYKMGQIEENPGPELIEIASRPIRYNTPQLAYFYKPPKGYSKIDLTKPPTNSKEYAQYWEERIGPDGQPEFHCKHCNRVFSRAVSAWCHLHSVFYPSRMGARGRAFPKALQSKDKPRPKHPVHSEEEMRVVYKEIFGGN